MTGERKGPGNKVRKDSTGKGWRWFGCAGHFICSQWCRFHLCTEVGRYLVSTVGEYVPDEPVREIHCQCHGITLEGRGDARLADYMKKVGFQPLGAGPHPYETMVFRLTNGRCAVKDCDCGFPNVDYREIDGQRSMTAGGATAFHMKMCEKYARERGRKAEK